MFSWDATWPDELLHHFASSPFFTSTFKVAGRLVQCIWHLFMWPWCQLYFWDNFIRQVIFCCSFSIICYFLLLLFTLKTCLVKLSQKCTLPVAELIWPTSCEIIIPVSSAPGLQKTTKVPTLVRCNSSSLCTKPGPNVFWIPSLTSCTISPAMHISVPWYYFYCPMFQGLIGGLLLRDPNLNLYPNFKLACRFIILLHLSNWYYLY